MRTALIATLGAAVLVSAAEAQTQRSEPTAYALTNARIVVAPGRTIERGTVVIRDGRIAAVGANVSAPSDVYRIDLAGRTVYAGLIDVASELGLPRPQTQGGGGPPAGAPTQFMQAQQRQAASGGQGVIPEIQPTRLASEVFEPREADVEAARAMGVTIAGLAFSNAIFPGQTAVVSLATLNRDSMVLRPSAALQVGLTTRRGGYPGTLMGTLAFIEQSFENAKYEYRVAQQFQRNPGSGPRPVHDPEREVLFPALNRQMPVWIHASRENDLHRAVRLAKSLGVEYNLVGAMEGYRVASTLAKEGRPVIVTFAYPDVDQVTGRAFEMNYAPASGRDSAKTAADSAIARTLRGNAAALVKAGVPIALTSYGLQRPADFRERVRGAIEAGLPADEALRALTVTPARLLGLERVAGTVEAGKLANLVVVEGDLFARDGRIRAVFIEGRRFEIREPSRQGAQQRAQGRGQEETR